MHSAYLVLEGKSALPFFKKWLPPPITYQKFSLKNSYEFLLCKVHLPPNAPPQLLQKAYRHLARKLQKKHICHVATPQMSDSFCRVFQREYAFTILDGMALKRLLYFPILTCFLREHNLSIKNTAIAICLNHLDKYRKTLLEKLVLKNKRLTLVTTRPAAIAAYAQELYEQTGCAIYVCTPPNAPPCAVCLALDFALAFQNHFTLSFLQPNDLSLTFEHAKLASLLTGTMDAFDAVATEFLLASLPHRPFAGTEEAVRALSFSLIHVTPHSPY